MSDMFTPRHHEAFTRLDVIRRVTGAESFIDRVRGLAKAVMGEELTSSVIIETELGPEAIPAGYPYCKVESADSLYIGLFSLRDIPENRSESRISELKKKLREGVKPPAKARRDIGSYPTNPPLLSELRSIQLANDFPREEVTIDLKSIAGGIRPDVKNGALILSLVPEIGAAATRMLLEQSSRTHLRVLGTSRHVGFPTRDFLPSVPFASVRKMPLELGERVDTYVGRINGMLPIRVTVGPPEIL